MGQLHARAYARAPRHFEEIRLSPRLVIAADPAEDVQARASQLGFESWTPHWTEVLDHEEVEAVSIAGPNWLHREVAVAAAERGRHVWIEKPAGRNHTETRAICEAIARSGVQNLVGFDLRFAPAVQRARALIDQGRLGEIRHARAWFLTDFAVDAAAPHTWRFSADAAGHGAASDLMSHIVDLLLLLVGPIHAVSALAATAIPERPATAASKRMKPVDTDDVVSAVLRFENGASGVAQASRIAAGHQSDAAIEIEGSRGALAWRFDRMNELEVFLADQSMRGGVSRVLAGPSDGSFGAFQPSAGLPIGYEELKVIQARDFLMSIGDGRARGAGVESALQVAQVVGAIMRSSETGSWALLTPGPQ